MLFILIFRVQPYVTTKSADDKIFNFDHYQAKLNRIK